MTGNRAKGFLEDIIAHPDDDTPRLIFADWLDDEGDSTRAEFIRVQIERARLPEWDAGQVRLRLRERELLAEHLSWKRELPEIKGVHWWEFRRGFVATASFANFATLKTQARRAFAATPIEQVSISWPRPDETLKDIRPIPNLRELCIKVRLRERSALDRLADAPLLTTLRVLDLRDCGLGAEGFRRLMASPHLGNVTVLRVLFNALGNDGIDALVHAVSLRSLAELNLAEGGRSDDHAAVPVIQASGMETLAEWPGLADLRSLTLSGNDLRQAGLRALLRSPHVTGLKELVLRGNGLEVQAMLEFSAAPPGLQLDVLDLGNNPVRNVGAAELVTAPCLREVKVLHLDGCEIQRFGARWLVRAPFLSSLRRLNVNNNSFGPDDLLALLEAKPAHLHTLLLANSDLGDVGTAHLSGSPASDTLLEVTLSQNDLGDPGAEELARSEHLKNLLILRLAHNRISETAAIALQRSPLGQRLAILETHEEDIPF